MFHVLTDKESSYFTQKKHKNLIKHQVPSDGITAGGLNVCTITGTSACTKYIRKANRFLISITQQLVMYEWILLKFVRGGLGGMGKALVCLHWINKKK